MKKDLLWSKHSRCLPLEPYSPLELESQLERLLLLQKERRLCKQFRSIRQPCIPITSIAELIPQRSRGFRHYGKSRFYFPSRRIGTDHISTVKLKTTRGEVRTSIVEMIQALFQKNAQDVCHLQSCVTEQME